MKNKSHGHVTDYSQITPYIYIGSDLCKGWTCPVHSKEFTKLGITAEVNLEIEHGEPVAPELEAYLQLPTRDETAPSHQQLLIAADVLDRVQRAGKITYVHCKNGHGRSPTAVAAYFIRYQRMAVEEAVSTIKKKRPEIHLNNVQLAALVQFQKGVREK